MVNTVNTVNRYRERTADRDSQRATQADTVILLIETYLPEPIRYREAETVTPIRERKPV